MTDPAARTVAAHFENRAPEVRRIYGRILAAAWKLGPVREESKKTSIHLVRKASRSGWKGRVR